MQEHSENSGVNLFGKVSMGYVLIESQHLDEWQRFCEKGLGLHLETVSDTLLAFRMDSHQRRLIIKQGSAEDVSALGWQLSNEASLHTLLDRFTERGIAISEGSAEEAALRGVKAFWRVTGPKRLAIEVFVEPLTATEPLWMLSSGFVTGDSGMGHVAITSRLPKKMQRFWQELFDARISDHIEEQIAGMTLDITFLRLNERHHTVAIAATRGMRLDPIRTQVQHMNLLVETLDDLSSAYRRLRNLGFEMAHEIGQHPNDKEVSFYVISPSGFEVELGWNALTVDESCWKTNDYHGISLWGHKPQNSTFIKYIITNSGNFQRSTRSLLHPEYSPI